MGLNFFELRKNKGKEAMTSCLKAFPFTFLIYQNFKLTSDPEQNFEGISDVCGHISTLVINGCEISAAFMDGLSKPYPFIRKLKFEGIKKWYSEFSLEDFKSKNTHLEIIESNSEMIDS